MEEFSKIELNYDQGGVKPLMVLNEIISSFDRVSQLFGNYTKDYLCQGIMTRQSETCSLFMDITYRILNGAEVLPVPAWAA
jgi:hypothetical protein